MNDLFDRSRLPTSQIEIDPGIDFDWSVDEMINGFTIRLRGGEILFSENFFSPKICERTEAYLQENELRDWRHIDWPSLSEEEFKAIKFRNIKWNQDFIKLFGKKVALPRMTSWYGDPGAAYTYSGIHSDPNPWNRGLSYLRDKIAERTGATFNSVLLNWYRNGNDSLSWHADDEKELGDCPTIASASFGASRDFIFAPANCRSKKLKIRLKSGSLLVMKGETQKNWVHAVPKRKGVTRSRFNLTFRYIHPAL